VKYFEEAKFLWKTYVPKKGQSETVQGELIRAIEKLRDEAQETEMAIGISALICFVITWK